MAQKVKREKESHKNHTPPNCHCQLPTALPPPTPHQEIDRPCGTIWEYPYGSPAREACCPHKGQRGDYSAGSWHSSARLSACAHTAK
eukprot:scaffold14989_cov113-Isochrysis_galbana.AAC.2